MRTARRSTTRSQAEIMEYIEQDGGDHRQEVRRPREPPAGFRPFRRPGLHARHDGHHPEPGPERGRGGGHGQEVRQPPLGVGLLPPLHPDVLRRGHGSGQEVLRAAHRRDEGEARASLRTWSSPPRTSRSWPSQFKAEYKAKIGQRLPLRSQGAADGRRQGRVPLLGQPPRQRLSPG